ncbi:glucosamine--fructose-6-phosphate aminotransferase, partial [Candidatus Magnetomorum sp. HK-1]
TLHKLEYRGYDSSGIATINNKTKLSVLKCVGKIAKLEGRIKQSSIVGNIGIGHTRWATHGEPTHNNCHPHIDCHKKIALVHNGIIENYMELRRQLTLKGHVFSSETDTEILAHLIEDNFQDSLEKALLQSLTKVKGTYALAIISCEEPNKIIAVKNGSPLIVGYGKNEFFLASDISAMLKYTKKISYLKDNELAIISNDEVVFKNLQGEILTKDIIKINMTADTAE